MITRQLSDRVHMVGGTNFYIHNHVVVQMNGDPPTAAQEELLLSRGCAKAPDVPAKLNAAKFAAKRMQAEAGVPDQPFDAAPFQAQINQLKDLLSTAEYKRAEQERLAAQYRSRVEELEREVLGIAERDAVISELESEVRELRQALANGGADFDEDEGDDAEDAPDQAVEVQGGDDFSEEELDGLHYQKLKRLVETVGVDAQKKVDMIPALLEAQKNPHNLRAMREALAA